MLLSKVSLDMLVTGNFTREVCKMSPFFYDSPLLSFLHAYSDPWSSCPSLKSASSHAPFYQARYPSYGPLSCLQVSFLRSLSRPQG